MIRFQCPTCRKVLKAPEHGAGHKVSCPRCGQRLLAPPPPQPVNRTVLGRSLPAHAACAPESPYADPSQPSLPVLPPGRTDATLHGAPVGGTRGRWLLGWMASGGCLGLIVLLGAVVAGAFLLPAKWSPKTYLPRQLGGEPATCRELVERLRARGMDLQMRPYNHGHPAVCVSESDTALLVLQEAHVRFEGVAIIVQFPTAQEAREEAGTEENAFAWGRFMIRADEQMLTQIKRRL